MTSFQTPGTKQDNQDFMDRLVAFSQQQREVHWSGSFSNFLETVFKEDPAGAVRSSHQYMWDMICWTQETDEDGKVYSRLFDKELFGVDDSIARVMDYFKAAAAGADQLQ